MSMPSVEHIARLEAERMVSESDGHLDCWHCHGDVWCAGCLQLRDSIAAALVDFYRNGWAQSEPVKDVSH